MLLKQINKKFYVLNATFSPCNIWIYNESIRLLLIQFYSLLYIIAKTICTTFQNEMCIFLHFFAVRLPAWNII